jgi:hypothetical protein
MKLSDRAKTNLVKSVQRRRMARARQEIAVVSPAVKGRKPRGEGMSPTHKSPAFSQMLPVHTLSCCQKSTRKTGPFLQNEFDSLVRRPNF